MNPEIEQLKNELRQLKQEVVQLREDAITINGSVDASTVQVNLRGIKRKITHAAP